MVNLLNLVRDAAGKFGPAKVVVAIDARRNKTMPSGFELVVSGGTRPVGQDAIAWAQRCEELGAGQLEHFYDAVVKGGAQIVLAASVFHFRTLTIRQVKEYLRTKGLAVNL